MVLCCIPEGRRGVRVLRRKRGIATDNLATFATLLTRYRAALGLTQEELTERAGLSVRAISDLERGVRTQPRAYTVHRLADALALSPEDRATFEASARGEANLPPGQDRSSAGMLLGALPEGELIAREEEHQRLWSALDAVRQGRGHGILEGGELGIGKTRLLQEVLVEAAERGCIVLGARCSVAAQQSALSPFLAALGVLAAAPPAGLRTEIQRGWKRIARMGALSDEGNGSRAHSVEQQELFRAIVDLVLLLSRSQPVVLVLDDLQWSDEASLLLLVDLARATHRAPLLVLGAFRDVRVSEEHPELAQTLQTLAQERLVDRLTIRRLSLEETTRLVGAQMGDQPVSDEFAGFVYRRTKGIPRLIEQIVRSLGGRLELEGEIGAGSMGRVFRAFDRSTQRHVAAKLVLARSAIDLDALLRFQQEGAVLARLHHPHIVEIHDTFAEEHASCIIMDLLEGKSLAQILHDGPLTLDRTRAIGLQVAAALSYAHNQEIVHRDIKPDNVMILENDQVKVTDFGIARILQPDTSLATIATTGMRMGTPLYMPPEQIEGKKIDSRADIYSLGAMLYHMLTGRPPFQGNGALAVAVQHLKEEPLPPSTVNAGIPAIWDALILKAMAKDPAKRFQSADQIRAAIGGLGERKAAGTTARQPWAYAALSGVIALAAVLVAVWVHLASGSQRAEAAAGVDAYLTQHHFNGYILLERHGQVLLSKGYGLADTKSGQPNTIQSKWLDAGVYRFMTAIAVLRLQDQHKLSVHDRLCRYVTACPRRWRSITIHQLLVDTSGLGSFTTNTVPGGLDQAIARCKSLPTGAPGAITSRSTCSGLLLNTVIVTASGTPWATAMHNLVFGPAHMNNTGKLTSRAVPPGWVPGYSTGTSVPFGNLSNNYVPYSSIDDLERMDQALLSGRLLSRSALHALFTPYIGGGAVLSRYFTANGSNATQLFYGYGTFLRKATGTTVMVADEPGSIAGISLDNAVSPEDGTIAIMARNDESGPDPTDAFFGPASTLFWGKHPTTPPSVTARSNQIARYLTQHRFKGYIYLERHGQVILSRGFGMADTANKQPNTLRTVWPAFGTTRFFVALAIMELRDQGKLSVQDRICLYISDCPAAWRPITIRELLLNTSGIGSFDPFAPGVTRQRTMAACRAMPLVSPSGFNSPWSDCNTFALGVILEKVTGKNWEAAMHDLVYGPAGMTETGLMTNALKSPRLGRFYRAGAPTAEMNYEGYYLPYTTVEDLVRLNHILIAGTLISHQSLDAMFTPVARADPSEPTAPWLGYDVVIEPATTATYKAVCIVCVNGGGEDDTATHAGFFITNQVSPAAGTVQIEISNDTAYFNPGDDDNAFFTYIKKPLYGK